MATSTSCWPYLPSLKMVRSCQLRTTSWIYKESHGQAISSCISSLILPAASVLCGAIPCSFWVACRPPVSPSLARVDPKWYLCPKRAVMEEQNLSPLGAHQDNAEHGWEDGGLAEISLNFTLGAFLFTGKEPWGPL